MVDLSRFRRAVGLRCPGIHQILRTKSKPNTPIEGLMDVHVVPSEDRLSSVRGSIDASLT